ncbi:MAG: FecR domain-containing protein [Desulfobacterium sp.]|nr:FecR domain-containing protein [Desulfobacterium sp.]
MGKKMNFLAIALLMLSADAWAQEHVGALKSVSGDVQIKRGDSFVEAHSGLQLMNSDLLITRTKGYAGVIFTDGTTVTIGPDTEFNINSYTFEPGTEKYDFSMYLKKGSAVYNSGKIGKLSPGSVKLSTPRATVGIRGTRFILKVE